MFSPRITNMKTIMIRSFLKIYFRQSSDQRYTARGTDRFILILTFYKQTHRKIPNNGIYPSKILSPCYWIEHFKWTTCGKETHRLLLHFRAFLFRKKFINRRQKHLWHRNQMISCFHGNLRKRCRKTSNWVNIFNGAQVQYYLKMVYTIEIAHS